MTWRNGKKRPNPKKICPLAKRCPKCKRALRREEFYFSDRHSDFLNTYCKECIYLCCRDYRERVKKQKQERALEWLKKRENK